MKRYDSEFPKKYYKEFLEYCSITDDEVRAVIDSWRSDHIWESNGSEWNLKKPVWSE